MIEITLISVHHSVLIRQIVLSWLPGLDGAVAQASNLQITIPFIVGLAMVWIAVDLRKRCFRELGPLFTINVQRQNGHKLVTTGPYSIVRHPSYAAVETLYAGVSLCNFCDGSLWTTYVRGSAWSVPVIFVWTMLYFVMPTALFLRRMPMEDAMLREAWPQAWEEWATRTPYRMIPFVYW